MRVFISFICLFFATLSFAQTKPSDLEADFTGGLGLVNGSKEGVHIGMGVEVEKGDFYKFSGYIGRESHDYYTVANIDALLKKNIKLGKSNTFLVLGYSPISLQSSSIANRTEALLTPKLGLSGKKTLVLYSFSPLASVSDREVGNHYKVFVHGLEFEQDIADIFKIFSSAKFAKENEVQYFNLKNQLQFELNPNIKLYGFYDLEEMEVINDTDRSVKQSTFGLGVKVAISRAQRE